MREFKCEMCENTHINIQFRKQGLEWQGSEPSNYTDVRYEDNFITRVKESYFKCKCNRCGYKFNEALK